MSSNPVYGTPPNRGGQGVGGGPGQNIVGIMPATSSQGSIGQMAVQTGAQGSAIPGDQEINKIKLKIKQMRRASNGQNQL